MRRQLAVALAVLATACAKPETMEQANARIANESATARAAVEQHNAAFAPQGAAGHADSVGMFYAADAPVMGNGQPVVNGREGIINMFRGMMALGTWHLTLTTDSVWANGPLILERGRYSLHLAKGPKAPAGIDTTDSGSFMVRWVKEGDRYLLADDLWNSDQAPAPAPARNR